MKQNNLKKVTHLFDEVSGKYLPAIDMTEKFKKLSKTSSAIKFKDLRSEKKKLLKKLKTVKSKKPPIPGGVGFGVYYKQDFQWAFSNFSCIDFCILTPPRAGGNSDNFLYLTATNGTAKGVEALISYNKQEIPEFKIFEWAKPENNRWVRSVKCSNIPDNFSEMTIDGIKHRYCRVVNKTEMIAPNIWENKVYLFNFRGDHWDQVYSFQYQCTLQEQKHSFQGSWGPIVETFQESFTDLNPMGFYNSILYNDKVKANLTSGNSIIRDDMDGIDVLQIKPNHSFLVS